MCGSFNFPPVQGKIEIFKRRYSFPNFFTKKNLQKNKVHQDEAVNSHFYFGTSVRCSSQSAFRRSTCKYHVFIYKPNINYCPKSAYVILVVIVVVVIMVVFVSVFNNKTNVSKYAYVILEQLLMLK